MTCTECDTRNADVLPSRGDCQTCLKARLDALDPPPKCWTCEDTRAVGFPTNEVIECPVTGRGVPVIRLEDCPDCV